MSGKKVIYVNNEKDMSQIIYGDIGDAKEEEKEEEEKEKEEEEEEKEEEFIDEKQENEEEKEAIDISSHNSCGYESDNASSGSDVSSISTTALLNLDPLFYRLTKFLQIGGNDNEEKPKNVADLLNEINNNLIEVNKSIRQYGKLNAAT